MLCVGGIQLSAACMRLYAYTMFAVADHELEKQRPTLLDFACRDCTFLLTRDDVFCYRV